MKRIAWLLLTGIALFTLWWFSITGYEIELSSDVTLYAAYENVPFEDMNVSGILHKGDKVEVFGCFDNKTDIYFFVKTKAGAFTYLYDLNFNAIKTWVPTQTRIRFFLHAPLASLQCLLMVPEFSSLNDKRVKGRRARNSP